ncbi:MAG: hypothetical protein QOE76_4101, partial [Frankiales bacterium]|nr:hypothetical protein [Frankiales bacterium]
MTSLTLSNRAVDSLKVDAVLIGVAKGPTGPVLVAGDAIDKAMGG